MAVAVAAAAALCSDAFGAQSRHAAPGGAKCIHQQRRITDYSTAYPSARALSRIRLSRVTIVTNCGGSPSNSAVARCMASSANGFNGKRPADTSEHRPVNVEDEAAPLEGSQGSNGRLFVCFGQPSGRARPDDRPACLCEGQGGRDVLCADLQRLHGCRVVLQQCGNERTRLHVADARRGNPGPARTRGGLSSRAWPRGATLRHDRCRSVQRRCPAAAGCPASPRTGRQLPREDGECRPQ